MKNIAIGSWVKVIGGKAAKPGTYAKVIDEIQPGIFLVAKGDFDTYIIVSKNLKVLEA